MALLTLLIIAFLSGSLIKITDDITDRSMKIPRTLAIPFGLAYGISIGYLMVTDTDASLLFGGIILGCLVTGKINCSGHYFGLAAILTVILLSGISLSPPVLLTAALAAFDEIGDSLPVKKFRFIFDYRLILKSGILVLVILEIIGLSALLILLAFDGAYIITERLNRRISHEI